MCELDASDAVADSVYARNCSLIFIIYMDEALGVLEVRILCQQVVAEYASSVRASAYAHQNFVRFYSDLFTLLILECNNELVALLLDLLNR